MTIAAKIRYRHKHGCRNALGAPRKECLCDKNPRLELRACTGEVWRRTVAGDREKLIAEALPFMELHNVTLCDVGYWLREWLIANYDPPSGEWKRLPMLAETSSMTVHKVDGGFTLTVHGRYKQYDYYGAVPLPGRYLTEAEAEEAGQVMLAREVLLDAADAKRVLGQGTTVQSSA